MSSPPAFKKQRLNESDDTINTLEKRLQNFVKWRKNSHYVDDKHEKFCKKKRKFDIDNEILKPEDLNNFTEPLVKGTVSVTFSVLKPIISTLSSAPTASLLQPSFDPKILNQKTVSGYTFEKFSLLYNINNYIRNTIGNTTDACNLENNFDMEWIRSMNEYLRKLTLRDLWTAKTYTKQGDEFCNNYLRGTFDGFMDKFLKGYSMGQYYMSYFPMFFQAVDYLRSLKLSDLFSIIPKDIFNKKAEPPSNSSQKFDSPYLNSTPLTYFQIILIIYDPTTSNNDCYLLLLQIVPKLDIEKFWTKIVKNYCDDLNRIINEAPALQREMVVYRGLHDHDDSIVRSNTFNKIYKSKGFVSTSLHYNTAIEFKNRKCGNYLQRITILPGTRVFPLMTLSAFPNEVEILLGSNSKFYVVDIKRGEIFSKLFNRRDSIISEIYEKDICSFGDPTFVSDLVLLLPQ